MPSALPPVLSHLDLPFVELAAARLDGEVFSIGDGFAFVDVADDSRHRGLSLTAGLPPRLVAERRTAAWVHGALDGPPRVHEFCVDIDARYRILPSPRHAMREVVLGPGDVGDCGGLKVTTPRRTAIDLLRRDGPLAESDAGAIRRLAGLASFTLGSLHDELTARRHLPGKRAVLGKLESLADSQPAETR